MKRAGCCILIPGLAATTLAGCQVVLGPPEIQAIVDESWTMEGTRPGAKGWAQNDRETRVLVWIWARDRYAPVGINLENPGGTSLEFRIRPVQGATVAPAIGHFRLLDAAGLFTPDRLPRELRPGEVVAVPAGGSAQISLVGQPLFGHELPEGGDQLALDIDLRREGHWETRPFRCRIDRVIGTMGFRMAGH